MAGRICNAVSSPYFATTPPTALYIDEAPVLVAVRGPSCPRGIFAPGHVFPFPTRSGPLLNGANRQVAHIRWDSAPVVRRILRWVANVARGKEDRDRVYTKAEFIEGGTIKPAPDGK